MNETPSALSAVDLLEQVVGLLAAEGGGRLIEDEQPGVQSIRALAISTCCWAATRSVRTNRRGDTSRPSRCSCSLGAAVHLLGSTRPPEPADGRRTRSRRSTDRAAAASPGGSGRCRRRERLRGRSAHTADRSRSSCRCRRRKTPAMIVGQRRLAGAVLAQQRDAPHRAGHRDRRRAVPGWHRIFRLETPRTVSPGALRRWWLSLSLLEAWWGSGVRVRRITGA